MRALSSIALAFIVVLIGNLSLSRAPARADAWPQRNVRIFTPFPAGTGGDVSARLFADGLSKRWGRPVVIENRPGADGIIAVAAMISARDDHTLLYTNGGPVTSNPFSHDKLPYDPVRDLVPISSGSDVFVAVSGPASLDVKSLAGFVDLARSQPGKLNWGATPGALDYLVPGFLKDAGLAVAHVSYREIAPALQDLAEARIQLYASALATQLPLVQTGKIRVLAITNRERAPLVPDAPTAAEAGFGDLAFEAFLGFFGPRDIPDDLRDRISADVRAVGGDPAISARLASAGLIVRTNTPAEFSEIIERERAKITEIVRTMERKPGR
jgi:tripartite-type tricarboxylate transporter receptor subunit TctC